MATQCGSRFDDFRSECIRTERPKLRDLYKYVTPCYAAQWDDIGVYLDIEIGHLDTIRANHPGDVGGCCKDLWKKWLELDPDATWDKLFTAIDDCAATSALTYTSIHSTTTSEPLAATKTRKCIPLDVSRLKARYIKHLSTEQTDWPLPYIRLALVKREKVTRADKSLEEITRLTLQGQIDELLLRKEPLGDLRNIFHYNNEDCPRLILIMGGPGIGKTTLCYELCLRWAKEEFLAENFDLVALIPLRFVQQRSLEEAIMEYIGEENYQQMMKLAGQRCLIILEGLDEIAMNRRQSDPFLLSLIKKCTILEKATILITSRPHACEEIDAGRRIEVVGFGNNEIREFTEKRFPNDIQSNDEFLQQLDEYPQLHSLCYIPMNLVMLVDIFHCSEKKLPSTLTELYRLFIVMTLKRQVKKEDVTKEPVACSNVAVRATDIEETLCVMLRGISKVTIGIVLCLSKLSYRGFFDWYCDRESENKYGQQKKWKEPKIIFTESDLDIEVTSDFDGFGLLKATPTHGLITDVNTYSFNHLTVQEFLCAVYISLQSQQEQLRLLREHFHGYPNVFTFVCGLTGLAPSPMLQFIYSKLTSPGFAFQGDPDVIRAMRCIYESKQSGSTHQSVSPFTLNLARNTLLPYDCVCVSHVLSCYPVLALNMWNCHIGDKGAELLVKHNLTGQLLEELNLRGNDLTSEGMEHVMKIVRTSSATLRVLDVSYNDISDDGITVISEALQHNKSLTRLEIIGCGLSVKGAVYISQLLNVTHRLQWFFMSDNDIGDDGMKVISEALQHNKSLTELWVDKCGLSVKGAVHISQLLNVTHTLQELSIKENDIGDDGMAVISEALRHNKSLMITKLGVAECGLSVKGAISISEMMMVNHSLQELVMMGNNIGNDGISAIAGALGNCKINFLDVQSCNITLIGARSLAAALSSNHTIRRLWLRSNAITVEGALLIVKSAVDNTVCQELSIDDEYEDDEVKKMKSILKDRSRQHVLQQPQITESIMESNNSSRDKELVHELPTITGDGATVNMERRLMNQSEDDDHSGGQEETRGSHDDDSLAH